MTEPTDKRSPPRSPVPRHRLTRAEIAEGEELAEYQGEGRPRTRAECRDGFRPCPFVSCQYHLYLDVRTHAKSQILRINFPDLEGPHELEHSCALDAADKGPMTLGEIGDQMNVTRERIRQLEDIILRKLRRKSLTPRWERLLDYAESLDERGALNGWDLF